MSEQVFLDERGVKVTKARFIVPDQTYAMSGITSVTFDKVNPSKKGPIFIIAIGLLMLGIEIVARLFFLAIGIVLFLRRKPTYYIILRSASGEKRALHDKNGAWIEKIITALNDASEAKNTVLTLNQQVTGSIPVRLTK